MADDAADVWAGRLGRFGLACRGVVYLVLALLAVQLVVGKSGEADQRGAFADIARHRFGWLVVVVIGLGFAGLALWQGWWALRARRAKGYQRLVAAGKAVVYLAFMVSAFSVAAGRSKTNSNQQTTALTARLMRHSLGQALVGAAGLAFCVGGMVLLWKAWRRRYDVEVHVDELPARLRRPFKLLGAVGMVGRGIVAALIGYFLVEAAVTFDPAHAKSLDAALRSVLRAPLGGWLLGLVGLALACFGCLSLLEARLAAT